MSTYLGQYKSKVYRKSFHSWWFSKSLEVNKRLNRTSGVNNHKTIFKITPWGHFTRVDYQLWNVNNKKRVCFPTLNNCLYLFWMKLPTFLRNSRTEWLNHTISLLELLIFTERKPVRWNGRVFFNRLENDPVDVDLSSGGISRAGVSRYLMSSLHQVLPSQGARSNRRYDYHLYIGWSYYSVTE